MAEHKVVIFETVSGRSCIGKLFEDKEFIEDVMLLNYEPAALNVNKTLAIHFIPYFYPYEKSRRSIHLSKMVDIVDCPEHITNLYQTVISDIVMPAPKKIIV